MMRSERKEKGKLFFTPLNPFNTANLNQATMILQKKKKEGKSINIHVIIYH